MVQIFDLKNSTNDSEIKPNYKQYLVWFIGHPPSKMDYSIIHSFLMENDGKYIVRGRLNKYRIFNEKFNGKLHILLGKRRYGFTINLHIDSKVHSEIKHNNTSLSFLSKIYLYLKKKYGDVVMIPREEKKFQGLIGHFFNKYKNANDITKVKKYKYKPKFR